jgi:hypothetical protein
VLHYKIQCKLTLTFILESSVSCNLSLNLPEPTGTRVPLSQRRSSDIWLVIGRNVFILPTWSGCWQALGGIQLIPSLSLCKGQTFMRPLKVNNPMRCDIRWPSDSISAEKSDRCPHFSPILFRYDFMSLRQSYNFTISVSFGCKLLKPQSVFVNTDTEQGADIFSYSATSAIF